MIFIFTHVCKGERVEIKLLTIEVMRVILEIYDLWSIFSSICLGGKSLPPNTFFTFSPPTKKLENVEWGKQKEAQIEGIFLCKMNKKGRKNLEY